MLWIWITVGLLLIPIVLYGLHRMALKLEEAGYLKYIHSEDSGGGSASAVLGEVDKITQPNAQRIVTETKDETKIVIKKTEGEGSIDSPNAVRKPDRSISNDNIAPD